MATSTTKPHPIADFELANKISKTRTATDSKTLDRQLKSEMRVLYNKDREVTIEEIRHLYQTSRVNIRRAEQEQLFKAQSMLLKFAGYDDPLYQKPWFCNIISQASLKKNRKSFRPIYTAAASFSKKKGWRFTFLTEKEIRTNFLNNVYLLAPYFGKKRDQKKG